MSYGLMVYAVDIDKCISAIGSKDEKLGRMIRGRFKKELARADEWFSSELKRGVPPLGTAIKNLIEGIEIPREHGFQYRYAFKVIVEHFGKFQTNDMFCPCHIDLFDEVEAQLKKMNAPEEFSIYRLAYHAPVQIPVDDFPGMGSIPAALCRQASQDIDWSQPASNDMARTLGNIRSWLNNANEKNWGLIGFYH